MAKIWTPLYKAWVLQFYKANAGLFAMCLLLLFGTVEARQIISYHYAVMQTIIGNPAILCIVLLLWILYASKCIGYCIGVCRQPDATWLYQCSALSKKMQWLFYFTFSILQWLPILGYAVTLAVVAISIDIKVSVIVISFQFSILFIVAASLFNQINQKQNFAISGLLFGLSQKLRIKASYKYFLLLYFLHQKKGAFFLTKLFSLLLISVFFVRNADHFDADLWDIFYPLAIVAHAGLVLHGVQFNEQWLSGNRNLPLPLTSIIAQYAFTWLLFLVPELLFLLINNHGNMPLMLIIGYWFTALASLVLFTGIAYGCHLLNEPFLLFIFGYYIALIFMQRWLGVWPSNIGFAALGITVFASHYYSFEAKK
jgi:hypothetical protein